MNHRFKYKWNLADGYPAENIEKNNLNVFGTFICGGGSTMGYKLAGFNHLGGVEIDKKVAETYVLNHKPKYMFNEDIRQFNKRTDLPKELYELDILDGSPPCFEAGTLVYTSKGFKAIELIQEGDLVLTHNNSFKKVTTLMTKVSNNYFSLKLQGSMPIKVTPEHPFYVRQMNRTGKKNSRVFSEPIWKDVKDLAIVKNTSNANISHDYVGVAINTNSDIPKWDGIEYLHPTQGKMVTLHKNTLNFTRPDFWYLVGRYLGDGWLRVKEDVEKQRYEVYICTGKSEKDYFEDKIKQTEFNYRIEEARTTYKFIISSKELAMYLLQFGRGAGNKRLTNDILDLPIDLLKVFLQGYEDADGTIDKRNGKIHYTSISKELLVGVQHCIHKVYNVPTSLIFRAANKDSYIEGRKVNIKDSYCLSHFKGTKKQQHGFYDKGYLWIPFRSKELINEELNVYNLSVEEDESYTVNNFICHNCSTFSMAGSREKAWGKEKQFREGQAMQTLDDLVFVYCDTIIKLQPKVFILENVKGIIQGNAKVYSKAIVQKMTKAGYTVQVFMLNAASMGVPQKRERVFFIGYKNELKFPKLKLEFNEKPILFSEIFEDTNYNDLTENESKLWNKKQHGDLDFGQINLRIGNKQNSFTTKLIYKDKVCNTVTGGDNNVLFDIPRKMTNKEVCQCGTYPLDYNFNGIEPKYLIGMSVPPVFTAQISHQIYVQWLSKL